MIILSPWRRATNRIYMRDTIAGFGGAYLRQWTKNRWRCGFARGLITRSYLLWTSRKGIIKHQTALNIADDVLRNAKIDGEEFCLADEAMWQKVQLLK